MTRQDRREPPNSGRLTGPTFRPPSRPIDQVRPAALPGTGAGCRSPLPPLMVPLWWFRIFSTTCGATPRPAMWVVADRRRSWSVQCSIGAGGPYSPSLSGLISSISSRSFDRLHPDTTVSPVVVKSSWAPIVGNLLNDRDPRPARAPRRAPCRSWCAPAAASHVARGRSSSGRRMPATSSRRCNVSIRSRVTVPKGYSSASLARQTRASSPMSQHTLLDASLTCRPIPEAGLSGDIASLNAPAEKRLQHRDHAVRHDRRCAIDDGVYDREQVTLSDRPDGAASRAASPDRASVRARPRPQSRRFGLTCLAI